MTTRINAIKASLPTANKDLVFDGSNWEDFARLVTLSKLERLYSTDVDNDKDQNAWLAQHFVGAAMDWVGSFLAVDKTVFGDHAKFCDAVQEQFGFDSDLLRAYRQSQLDALRWDHNLPVFFSELDRLVQALGVTSDDAKIAILRGKMPDSIKAQLAGQGLNPLTYSVLRARILTMWALHPKGPSAKAEGQKTRPKCAKCGKKGHRSNECRSNAATPAGN